MTKKKNDVPWPADKTERWPITALRAYERNARTHSDAQIVALGNAIKRFGFTAPVLIAEDGTIIAGHGRVDAARHIGLTEVPVVVATGWTDEERKAFTIWDNQSSAMSSWDNDLLKLEIEDLKDEGFEIGLLGFEADEIDKLLAEPEPKAEEPESYSRKIEAPIYEPKGEQPAVAELFDDAKTRALVDEIRAAGLPAEIEEFLIKAAERHTSFDFAKIAEFYASADAGVQRLMEHSALVIIDFDQAIERGFVKLTKRLGDLASGSTPDADA